MEMQKTSKVSTAVFIFGIVVVGILYTALFFPSLIVTFSTESDTTGDPFELGTWVGPVLTTNLVILGFGILYYKKKLPSKVRNAFNFIINFEVSRNVAILVMVSIIGFYVGGTYEDLLKYEGEQWGDFERVNRVAEIWPEFLDKKGLSGHEILYVKNFFLKSSLVLFDNIKVIPFLASTALLVMTYFFTVKISNKRFAGLVAMVIVLQSHTFLRYDTLASYSNFWTLFYLLSLYLIYVKWPFSSAVYLASMFCKSLTAAFFPLTLFLTYRAPIPRRKKLYITASYAVLVVIAAAGIIILDVNLGGGTTTGRLTFDSVDFWAGFPAWTYQLRFDGLLFAFLLPLVVGLYLTARRGLLQADSILILILGALLVMPFLSGMTGFNLHPYRYVPLIVFFGIGVGTLLSKKQISYSASL